MSGGHSVTSTPKGHGVTNLIQGCKSFPKSPVFPTKPLLSLRISESNLEDFQSTDVSQDDDEVFFVASSTTAAVCTAAPSERQRLWKTSRRLRLSHPQRRRTWKCLYSIRNHTAHQVETLLVGLETNQIRFEGIRLE